jgi:fucose 4-O-acetylase-like acetyltransferase
MHSHPNSWIVALGGFLVVSLCAGFLRSTNMLDFSWKDVSLYYLVAICGTLMIYSVSNKICQNESWIKRTLTFIGENTLTILTWHFLCFKIVSILIIAIYGLPIKQLAEFPVIREYSQDGWFLAYLFIGVSVPLCFSNRVSTWLGKLKLKIKNL